MHVRIFISACQEALGRPGKVAGPAAVNRLGHGNIFIKAPEVPAGIKGRMGLGEAGPEEKRAGGIPGFQEIDGLVNDPGGDAVFYLHCGNDRFHLALADAVRFGAGGFGFPVILAHVV